MSEADARACELGAGERNGVEVVFVVEGLVHEAVGEGAGSGDVHLENCG